MFLLQHSSIVVYFTALEPGGWVVTQLYPRGYPDLLF